MVICRSCGAEVGYAKFCPQCGSPVTPPAYPPIREDKTKPIIIAVVVVVAVLAILAIAFFVWLGSTLEEQGDVYITDFDVERPNPYSDEVEVSFTLHNEADRDATVSIEYTFEGSFKAQNNYNVLADRSRRITETFDEHDAGIWEAEIISVSFH